MDWVIKWSKTVKTALFILGYGSFVSFLRAASHTFDVMFGRYIGGRLRFGLALSVLFLFLCMGLLLFTVWAKKNKKEKESFFRFWRNLDIFLLIFFMAFGALFLLSSAYNQWSDLFSFFLPLLAYTAIVVTTAELTARIRDGDLLRTSYWVRFYRVYPVWRPMGLLITLLLFGHLFIFIILEPASTQLRLFSALSFVALTYFMAVLSNLNVRHEKAAAEKLRAERFKSELITNVSHDIRTPLTSIINYVDLLKSEPLENKAAEYAEVITRKSQRLKILIDDLMEASKAGTGNMKIEMQTVNLSELIGQIAGEYEGQFAERDLTLVLRQPDLPISVDTDPRHLWRACENLFTNAAKYALPGTRVFAEIREKESTVIFSLKNTSQNPIDLPGDELTEQFIRGDRARQTEGSGLGLYIARSLIALVKGRFTIRVSGDLFEAEISLPVTNLLQ
jgi:signal transduction histidine kinase